MAVYIGFNPPFLGGVRGIMSPQADERLIKNDLIQLLKTARGEREHRPIFGTLLRTTVFENITDEVIDALRNSILEAIRDTEDRVNVIQLDITPDEDRSQLNITLSVALVNNPLTKFTLDLLASQNGLTIRR